MDKKVRIGIFGLNRGMQNARAILFNGAEIVAICDKKEHLHAEFKKQYERDVPAFTDFDEFIEQDMDAVYLANYFPEHTPYAIKALSKNIHVLSECASNSTMAEGVSLVRAAEKSKAIYMLAENYPYMVFNQEMQKLYKKGVLGKILFGEGEYNHTGPGNLPNTVRSLYDSEYHWRNHLPATYYLTHSLAPLMFATRSNPIRVTAMPIFSPKEGDDAISASKNGDNAAIITILNDDDSVFRITGHASFGFTENSYRLACTKGQIENVRGTDGKVMLTFNPWQTPKRSEIITYYYPREDERYALLAARTGHFGSDFYMFKDFFDCIKYGRKPYLDVYVATTMASVGILAHRSLLKYGEPVNIPNFKNESDRILYENDTLTPFYTDDYKKEPTMPVCSHTDFKPSEDKVKRFREALSQ